MKLFEYEAKEILKKYGIPVAQSGVASTADEVEALARKIGKTVVLKSQILVAGRGKAGGIKFPESIAEAKEQASQLIGATIKGIVVKNLMVEEKLDITDSFYASITVDRQAKTYVALASTEGGVDIEQIAEATPEKIVRHWIDPINGFSEAEAGEMVSKLGMSKDDTDKFASVLNTLYTAAMDNDAEMVELNPMVKVASGEFMAADARIIVDDNALFRHPEFEEKSLDREEYTVLEAEAKKNNLAYVDLDGDIGIVGNGAGLVMATLDLVSHFGGKPANFLDIGGGGNVDITKRGILLVMSKPAVKSVLVNILGGITRCDVVAEAVIKAIEESSVKKPVVVRMMGTNEEEGARMLSDAGINSYPNMEKAVEEVIKL